MGRASLPFSAAEKLGIALVWLLAAAGCKPKIGDKCSTSTDCSQTGDRLCDISEPNGYCTIYNCEPKGSNAATSCPDEAACIAFASDPSSVPGCQSALGATPYQRTFCLKRCDNGRDCRDGYTCEDPEADARFGAVDVDGRVKVCMVAFSAKEPTSGSNPPENGVCTQLSPAPDAGTEPMEPSGAGGAGENTGPDGTAGSAEPGSAGTAGN
jgi:hypothetical protein